MIYNTSLVLSVPSDYGSPTYTISKTVLETLLSSKVLGDVGPIAMTHQSEQTTESACST